MESCLAGQQDIGPGPHGITQKVVTRSTGDGHAPDRLPGIADHLHRDVAQRTRDEGGELVKAPGLYVMADAAGTGTPRRDCGGDRHRWPVLRRNVAPGSPRVRRPAALPGK